MAKSKDQSTELTIVEPQNYAVLAPEAEEMRQVVAENTGGQGIGTFDLDRIKVPGAGGTQWEVPSIEGDKTADTIEGVIVYWRQPRSYWDQPFEETGGGVPPKCSSPDGVHGFGDPGGECAKCPLSQFESAEKNGKKLRGQACKQMRFLFIVTPDGILPKLIVAPPTSIKPLSKYFLGLASKALPYYGVVTRMKLIRDKNADGISYSFIEPTMASVLPPELRLKFKEMGNSLRPTLDAAAVHEEVG